MVKSIPVVILCGGEGTRLYPVTKTTPKSLVEVAEKPFIEHQLELFSNKGVKDVCLLVGKFGEMIEEHLGNSHGGISIQYSYDNPAVEPGTGNALINAFSILPNRFILTYGDSYLDFPWPTWSTYPIFVRPVMMTVYNNEGKYCNVEMKGDQVKRYCPQGTSQEMKYIECGLTYINKPVLRHRIERGFSDMLHNMVNEGKVGVFQTDHRPYEIGTFKGLKETEDYIYGRK